MYVLASSVTTPRCTKAKLSFASFAAIRRSHCRGIVSPIPTAAPLMAAMMGLRIFQGWMSRTRASGGKTSCASPLSRPVKVPSPPPRSAPAQKARPAPVTMMARTESSSSRRLKARMSSAPICGVKAFSRWGRFSVSSATLAFTSQRTVLSVMSSLPAPPSAAMSQ
jgi:hypothetical protein